MSSLWKQTILPGLSLFTSVGTLLCCALPALLVSLGMGAALAGFISAVPWITAISAYQVPLFIVAGLLLAMAGVMQWRARHAPCPDPAQAKACMRLRMISWIIWAVAAFLYVITFFAFVAVYVFFEVMVV